MKVELAPSAGFCFGVRRAVELIDGLLRDGRQVCTLGPVIHNPSYVAELREKGVRTIEKPEEAPEGSVIVLRSHGITPETRESILACGLEICDATCPYVKKIHNIVQKADPSDSVVLIAGDPSHPEVEGIRGHAKAPAYVFQNLEELKALMESHPEFEGRKLVVVAQTTFLTGEWINCNNFMKKAYTNSIIFDTICSATSIRQQEAEELAGRSDAMVVVGGRESSNTRKLYEICSERCPTFFVENARELPTEKLRSAGRIGVTAGASTPACIIKEVLNTMSGLDNIDTEDVDFAAELEKSFKTLSTDERVRGVVAAVAPNEVQVDLGTKHAGYIPLSELTDDPSLKPEQIVKVGDEIDLVVLRVNDQDGTVMLSKRRVDAVKNWDDIVAANEDGTVVSGVITDVIKGGVLASVKGVRVFVPASQTGVPRDGSLDTLLRQTVRLKIIEINSGRRRAVGSIRAVQRDEKRLAAEKFWEEVEIGREYTGTVKSMTSYGAFIDLGGVDGMIHVSELSWVHIKHPNEVLSIGDTVKVSVKDLNRETKKVSLTYTDKGENPWDIFLKEYKVGDIVTAEIVSFMPFGSFAQIIPGVDGLIHISQISEKRIARPQEVLAIGQKVPVKIIEINEERKRISLSMREAENEAQDADPAEPEENQ